MTWHPDTPERYRNAITIGDARLLWTALPPSSVDAFICDPIYRDDFFYFSLAQTALRTLRPHGLVLAFTSKPNLANVRRIMEAAGLEYVFDLSYVVVAKAYPMRFYGLFTWTTPCIWMQVPGSSSKTQRFIPDTFIDYSGQPSSDHEWNKSMPVVLEWVDAFTKPGAVICDPCTGSSPIGVAARMLDRRYIGFEIDAATAWDARARIAAAKRITYRQQRLELPADSGELIMVQASMEALSPVLGGPAAKRPKNAR